MADSSCQARRAAVCTLKFVMQHVSKKGHEGFVAHLKAALAYSCAGLHAVFSGELAFRMLVFEAMLLLALALWLAKTWTSFVLLLLATVLPLLIELLNSAIEATCDRISLEWHPLVKKAKDAGSAAQFTAQLLLLIVWLSYFCFAA